MALRRTDPVEGDDGHLVNFSSAKSVWRDVYAQDFKPVQAAQAEVERV